MKALNGGLTREGSCLLRIKSSLNIHKSKGNLSKWNSDPVDILKRLLFSLFDLCASKCLAGLKSPRHQEDSPPIKEKLIKVTVNFLIERTTRSTRNVNYHFLAKRGVVLSVKFQHFYSYQLPWVRFRSYQHVHATR